MANETDQLKELEEQFRQTVRSITQLYVVRFVENLERARGLVEMYEAMVTADTEVIHGHREDILRAAVVFMHASLEELLRELAINLLPHASETVLNEIPLAGSGAGRAEKFYLGKLRPHEKKSVQELIEESIREHFGSSNFGNIREISNLLRALDLESDEVKTQYPVLAAMMDRRHQIVHRADNVASPAAKAPRPIDAALVEEWRQGLMTFLVAVAGSAIASHLIKKGAVEPREDGLVEVRGLPGHYK